MAGGVRGASQGLIAWQSVASVSVATCAWLRDGWVQSRKEKQQQRADGLELHEECVQG